MKKVLVSLLGIAAIAACSAERSQEPVMFDKTDVYSLKADTDLQRRLCRELGLAADCDLCDLAGWYGDGECDTFCNKPDPDCGTQCQGDRDCPAIYCVTSPCPQNICVSGKCELQHSNQCFGAWVDLHGGCRSANDGVAPAECCSCDGARFVSGGFHETCMNEHDVAVDTQCCTDAMDAGTPDCSAQDVAAHGNCGLYGVYWDGTSCQYLDACTCRGSDCNFMYNSIEDCEAAYSKCGDSDGGVPKDCHVGGCSGQVCSDDPGVVTTCEWRSEYACYQDATCELQADGKCGWTDTPELQRCLDSGGPDTYDPCENKKCGDSCTVCPPNDPACTESAALKSCNEYGTCTPGAASCDPANDCRSQGCASGQDCSFCWTAYQCIPEGAIC